MLRCPVLVGSGCLLARRLLSVEAEFSTDFAIVNAAQAQHGAASGSFAGTCPGALSAMCGTKYAAVHIRAERWDARPPYARGWEDADELPFAGIAGGGPLMLGGFDDTDIGLDVDDLGSARALLYARGRHRYGYSDFRPELPPEEWLLQVFPTAPVFDVLAGDPRRLSGGAPFGPRQNTGWSAAMHAWSQTGWHHYLYRCPWFYEINLALSIARRPISREELARTALPFNEKGAAKDPAAAVHPLAVALQPALLQEHPNQMLLDMQAAAAESISQVATVAGVPEMRVLGDFIQALCNLGLLLPMQRNGEELLVPNACPGMVWDVVEIPEGNRGGLLEQIGYADFRHVAEDLRNLLGWAPAHRLRTTARSVAVRLAVAPPDVLGAIDLLAVTKQIENIPSTPSVIAPGDDFDVADAPLEFALRGPS